jgi:hypothetical protein
MRRRLGAVLPLTALLAGLTAGCGDDPPEPGGDRLDAKLVTFDPDAKVRPGLVARGDAPIDPAVVAGWTATEGAGSWGPPRDRDDTEPVPDLPGRSYVLVTSGTGCRLSDSAELWRDGDDLRVRFVGGQDHEECYRPYNTVAQFELETGQIDGVQTVLGKEPVPGEGPAELTGFVPLGPAKAPSTAAVEIRGTAGQTLYAELSRGRASNLAQAREALYRAPAAGHRGYAFVLSGCAETGAQLLVAPQALRGELTGGGKTVCVAPALFLATFEIPAKLVPAKAVPV